MYIYIYMAKVISLSEEAYQTMKNMKRGRESFSDVVMRVARVRKKGSLADFCGIWAGSEYDEALKEMAEFKKKASVRDYDEILS